MAQGPENQFRFDFDTEGNAFFVSPETSGGDEAFDNSPIPDSPDDAPRPQVPDINIIRDEREERDELYTRYIR